MPIDRDKVAELLRDFALRRLFVEELGWDNPQSGHPEHITVGGETFSLLPVAEKRGIRIFNCPEIPERATRQKIERAVTKLAYEHLIIFTDQHKTRQIWQWVARERGKPTAFREHLWLSHQSTEPLLQKFDHIAFSLDEEEALTLAGATVRLRDAFDRERITKRFYEDFKKQHDRFLGFIKGLSNAADKGWYASLMLNRLMFVYFIQKKGFLDGDIHYLRSRLALVRESRGKDQFHSFYRAFLLKLFHGGLATPVNARDAETSQLIGEVPYLNGGLFEPHTLESDGATIEIADAAFEAIFTFFDQYEWTLDTRAIERADGREINPDVLGHIFEKYINQKQMGAYYTKEDITDYITRCTVIPWLFRNAQTHDRVAFEAGGAIWRMLSEDPDAYILEAVRHGANDTLPDNIAAGLDDISKRNDWNRIASPQIGLPSETWREAVARRARYATIRGKAAAGQIINIEDLITYNLDIRQFALDTIQYAESPDLVRAFWRSISAIKVLDPACGSGAFIFAALNILYDLYDACLDRMEQFVESSSPGVGSRQLYADFHEVLAQIARHPNRSYFIYKSIILDNLYGVDIMDEAVEICKLRLFLKLAAQLQRPDQIEPLPDVDFNIRPGNTLIGYTSFDDLRRVTQAKGFDFDDRAERIEAAAHDLDTAFRSFREQQTALHGHVDPIHKADLRTRLTTLETQLDWFLAQDYGIQRTDGDAESRSFLSWKRGHKPFHWLLEFYGIMAEGGFHAIVGNPPYVEYSKVRDDYKVQHLSTLPCGNLYAFFAERSELLRRADGLVSFIVPLSIVSTPNMKPVMDVISSSYRQFWVSYYSNRPDQLFEGAQNFLAIYIGSSSNIDQSRFTTGLRRWPSEFRDLIFETLEYAAVDISQEYRSYAFPKFQSDLDQEIWNKLSALREPLSDFASPQFTSGASALYCYGGVYWTKARTFESYVVRNGKKAVSTADRPFRVREGAIPDAVVAILNSTLHFWFWVNFSDCRNKTYNVVLDIPTSKDLVSSSKLADLGCELMGDYRKNSQQKVRDGRNRTVFTEFYPKKSKALIDDIDREIGDYLGFSADELDYLVNYDIKYRMGAEEEDESE